MMSGARAAAELLEAAHLRAERRAAVDRVLDETRAAIERSRALLDHCAAADALFALARVPGR